MEISNETKAKEIAKKLSHPNIDSFGDGDDEFDTQLYHTNKDAALEAMQWKDEEHQAEKQKLIDEACKWLEVNDSYAKPNHLQMDRLREHLNNIK